MGQYLTKFSDKIGKRQTEQIVRLLNQRRDTGQIRSAQEFTEQLSSLIREITSTELQPTLKLFEAEQDDRTDSETHNFMLDRVQDDLEAAFEETINIDEIQRSHEAIIRDVVLKNLRAGLAELEAKIDLYEFLNSDNNGFDTGIFSTFRESKEGRLSRGRVESGFGRFTGRAGKKKSTAFTDPRTGEFVSTLEDAVIDLVGERLVLASTVNEYHAIKSVRQLFDSESPQSEEIVEPAGNNVMNIIDDTVGTYWTQSLLFKEKKNFVKVKFEFDLGAFREVNFLQIEPATQLGMILESIHYYGPNNTIVELDITERLIETPVGILIKKIFAQKIILTFRNENPIPLAFKFSKTASSILEQANKANRKNSKSRWTGANLNPPTGRTVAHILDNVLVSPRAKQITGIRGFIPEPTIFRGYRFDVGLDNVRVGITNYRGRSIYVSTPLQVTGAGQVGLKTIESRPYRSVADDFIAFTEDVYDHNEDNEVEGENGRVFLGSNEFYVIKEDLSESGRPFRTTTFPIVPLGTQRIHHERLILNEQSEVNQEFDIGRLNLFTNRTDGDIKVFRNGELISDETDGVLTNGWTQVEDETLGTPNSGVPMKLKMQVASVSSGDIFTVSYNPLTSNTSSIPRDISAYETAQGLKIVDLAGDMSVRLERGQVVTLDRVGEDDSGLVSNLYLVILMRLNTADSSLTPAVEEYTLMTARKDDTKFQEL